MLPVRPPTVAATILRLDDGRELAFAEYGDPAGAPVLGCHGTPGSRLQLADADGAARARGLRLVVPDRPGYGASDFAPRRRLVDWARDVAAVADHLGLGRFAVLGVSGGGPHALAAAAGLPDRVRLAAVVSGLAPMHGTGLLDDQRPLARLVMRAAARRPAVLLPLAAPLTAVGRRWPSPTVRAVLGRIPEPDQRVLADPHVRRGFEERARRASRTSARAAAQDVGLFARPWGFSLEAVAVPVRIFHGTEDATVPLRHAQVLAAGLPQATLEELRGEGHLFFAERMDDVLRAVAADLARGA